MTLFISMRRFLAVAVCLLAVGCGGAGGDVRDVAKQQCLADVNARMATTVQPDKVRVTETAHGWVVAGRTSGRMWGCWTDKDGHVDQRSFIQP